MKLKAFCAMPLLSLLLSGCIAMTSGNVSVDNGKDTEANIKKELKMANFKEIKACQGIKVIVKQGKYDGTISVATTASAEKYLKVEVTNGTLTARYDNRDGAIKKIKGPSIISVVIPDLQEVDFSSGATLDIKGNFHTDSDMEFELSSAALLNIENLSCRTLSIETSSGATVNADYLTCNLEAESSSGSAINVQKIKGGGISLEASSGSSVTVNSISSASIKTVASSGASINVSGKTGKFSKSESSGASVNHSKLSF